jgi:putative acetyltransferase
VTDLLEHPAGQGGAAVVARDGDVMQGFALLTIGTLDTFDGLVSVGVLGPLAVGPGHQRKGVGKSLVAEVERQARARELPVLFLEGDPAYYSRLGFLPAKPMGMRKPSIRIPDGAFQCITLDGYSESMTGTLVYPEPFWTHNCVGLRDPEFIEWLRGEVAEGRQL